uniref:HAGH_C domain-containing protein n=1 Tax=Macrostomum lignano TaxID=282301 RepID=A0A1I8F8N9_9PLAT
ARLHRLVAAQSPCDAGTAQAVSAACATAVAPPSPLSFNGAPFLTLADFCSLLGDLGFSAAPELQNGGLSIVQQPAAPTMDNDNSKLDQRQKQTEQQQRQPRRRNSCSSVSSSDDSSSGRRPPAGA